MTKQEFDALCLECVDLVRRRAPRDTGNLATNGITFVWEDENTFTIYVNESIAPYMPYTNEPWKSPKWNGKKNPNEAWWQDAIKIVIEFLEQRLNGSKICFSQ